ncbi:glutamate synthase-related protein [Bacillus fonticola]|uniref:glutamate synthase-related protein n=1 Tax=Bacillus fonticola TaxID=2728853 RepID=UPI001475EAE9|nr:glutamate synthase-related protein [Bacillus fonticola]
MTKWTPAHFQNYRKAEHDACGIVAALEKTNTPTKENITTVIDALVTMNHRAGFINGEGDGVGIHTDIPRALWCEKLAEVNRDPVLVNDPRFVVGHVMIRPDRSGELINKLTAELKTTYNAELLFSTTSVTNNEALGPLARSEAPVFWQFAILLEPTTKETIDAQVFDVSLALETDEDVHVASLSPYHVVYKVMGAGDILPNYYADLRHPLVASTMTLGHNRYSTNTMSTFFRVQPFSVIGHNGEINTIAKLQDEARMLNVPLVEGGSDSQNLNRTLETLIHRDGYSLFEAVDLLFPPIVNEIHSYPEHLHTMYTYIREAWGHYAQGPAGIISRHKDEAVFSLDSLGLRPLWMLTTETAYLFSSEPGILPTSETVRDPKPLSPGEKVGLKWHEGTLEVYFHDEFQEEVYQRFSGRVHLSQSSGRLTTPILPSVVTTKVEEKIENGQYKAFGWERDHVQMVEQMADKGAEPIRSLGHDAPLAAMNPNRSNVADFIKESVAVVTNPAIDRDRETEHFSTRTVLGKRPSLTEKHDANFVLQLSTPLLVEGMFSSETIDVLGQPTCEQVVHAFTEQGLTETLSLTYSKEETVQEALDRLSTQACAAVQKRASLLVLDDEGVFQDGKLWLDPHLATSVIDKALVSQSLRRDCSLLLRSASIRSLHDCMVALGLGANALSPYYMFRTVTDEKSEPILNLYQALVKGMEKVISTIGIHELRGYGRLFSSIGLHEEVANALRIVNFFGSEKLGYHFAKMKEDAYLREAEYYNEKERIGKSFNAFPRIWKAIGDVAKTGDYTAYRDKMTEQETKNPTTIRHLTTLKESESPLEPSGVDLTVGTHNLPFVIASMSFGSQNEVAFRAYAEGADRLNMVSMNGEGGEIKDMLGKYPNTRGQQIASGRFGVNAELLNSSNLLEIKIGQGAKPGEGGHLPGSKVTAKIAEARNATIGSDLISPSNNHDIYSIEDLAQMIHELKTANDQAKVAVKVPVVPNIGTIAVGIAKAGADIVTVSGFDGGTGAARTHALQHVGLPVEIGVKAAHTALSEAGLRDSVEIWADGGLKSATDVLKVMLLGANRVGFGTLSMIAIGCTTCRGCHLDTCHVGIATQIESEAQAKEHGLRRFVPRQSDLAVEGLVNFFTAFGSELQSLAASIGVKRLQDAVGRSELLEQVTGFDQLDLTYLLQPVEVATFTMPKVGVAKEKKLLAAAVGAEYLDEKDEELMQSRNFASVVSNQRILGSRVSGHRVRDRLDGSYRNLPNVDLRYLEGSIPGNGLGSYNSEGIHILVNGGAQDGVGKSSFGGRVAILKGRGKDGRYYNGSVGKGFGYGAQKGTLIAQGNADARAGIRLSGADLILGGLLTQPLPSPELGNVGSRANVKGFAFEYMTNGRGLVLGDPGPWACAGMTGGVVYLRHQPNMGLTKSTLSSRMAKGAKVTIEDLSDKGVKDIVELLSTYIKTLRAAGQVEEAEQLSLLLENPQEHFVQVVPVKEQADPSVSTE